MDEYIERSSLDDDGLGKTKPELHLFTEQSKDDVVNMFKKSDMPKLKPMPEGVMDAPRHHKPCLAYENAPACIEEILRCKPKEKDAPEDLALWRKLAGVRPQENVEGASKVPVIIDAILVECKRKFSSELSIEMPTDHWNPCLVINGAKTRIKADDLLAALDGLKYIVDEDEAARIVSNIVVKKIAGLFV